MVMMVIVALSALIVTCVVIYMYRYLLVVKSDSDLEEEQDEDMQALTSNEMVGLIHSSASEGEAKVPSHHSNFKSIYNFLLGTKISKPARRAFKKQRVVTRKYHKAQFFPVINETVAWYTEWEAKNHRNAMVGVGASPLIISVSPDRSVSPHVQAGRELFKVNNDKLRTISFTSGQELVDIIHVSSSFGGQPHTAITVT